jgi:sterol 3beta-glucosyltransferase
MEPDMRIVFFSYGTRGDAQPQVALAAGLVARGIEARVAAPENLRSFVERAGVEYAPLYGNSQTILESEEGQRWLRSGNVRAFMSSVAEIARELDPHVFASGLEAARGADMIVGGTLIEELSVTLAEHLRIPFTFAHTIPCEPTGAYPCPLVTTAKLPWAFLNRATYALFRRLAFPIHRDAINVFRRELGLPPQTATAVGRARELGVPALQLWSPHLVPHPADAYAQAVTTGSIRVPASVRARLGEAIPSSELVAWLEAGPPPVYLGFGSMPMPTLETFTRDVLALAEALDLRFVVCGGWNDTEVVSALAGPRVHFVRAVDHGWLFPRCAVVVHHGGAGTTFAAAEAGVPSVVCSFFADQPFWGSRIAALGVGTHVPFVKLNQRTLHAALQRALSEDTRSNAAELGRKLRNEDGNAKALDALERIVRSGAHAASAT